MPAQASVLVVDDEPLIAMMIADWLTECGCLAVGPVGTVKDALALIEKGGLDAVLLDVTLGSGNSFELAEQATARGLPVAFITGRLAADMPETFKSAPVLGKPFEYEAFEAMLAVLLPGAHSRASGA